MILAAPSAVARTSEGTFHEGTVTLETRDPPREWEFDYSPDSVVFEVDYEVQPSTSSLVELQVHVAEVVVFLDGDGDGTPGSGEDRTVWSMDPSDLTWSVEPRLSSTPVEVETVAANATGRAELGLVLSKDSSLADLPLAPGDTLVRFKVSPETVEGSRVGVRLDVERAPHALRLRRDASDGRVALVHVSAGHEAYLSWATHARRATGDAPVAADGPGEKGPATEEGKRAESVWLATDSSSWVEFAWVLGAGPAASKLPTVPVLGVLLAATLAAARPKVHIRR